MKVNIIILNYLAYEETIKCAKSILKNWVDEIENVIIVDNHSMNESAHILSKFCKRYEKFHFIRTGKNYGYAKGNNIGVKYARMNFSADCILLLNSDVVIPNKDYFCSLFSHIKDSVGVVSSQSILSSGIRQDMSYEDLSVSGVIRSWIAAALRYFNLSNNVNFPENYAKKKYPVIHGCVVLLTPTFFRFYNGLYPGTFLYAEEIILSIMLDKVGLGTEYESKHAIIHNERSSSRKSYGNKQTYRNKLVYQSYKHAVWVKILPYFVLKRIVRG